MMWMMVLFDLPVMTDFERSEANRFRVFLKKQGFTMAQYSVYYKSLSGKEMIPKYEKRVKEALPQHGQVDILYVTDKQFENIVSYYCRKKGKKRDDNNRQLLLY